MFFNIFNRRCVHFLVASNDAFVKENLKQKINIKVEKKCLGVDDDFDSEISNVTTFLWEQLVFFSVNYLFTHD